MGLELISRFIEVGYHLFRDRDRLEPCFIAGDILDPDPHGDVERMLSPPPPTTETPSYNTLVFAHLIGSGIKGNVDMFYAGAFVNYEAQVKVCHQLVEMLRPLKSTKTSTHAEDMGRASGHYRCTGSTQVSAGADKNQLIFGGQVGFLERGKHYMHSGLDRHHPQRTDQHTGWQVEV